jgi:hypothetical protein
MTEVEWLRFRREDVLAREFGNSLRAVERGRKPMGCLGVSLGDMAWMALSAKGARLRRRGILPVFSRNVQNVRHVGFLYLLHLERMNGLLQKRAKAAEMPDRVWPFVNAVIRRAYPVQTAAYDLIADAFGDALNPGRTDFPGTTGLYDPVELLRRYSETYHEPDPSEVFFRLTPAYARAFSEE